MRVLYDEISFQMSRQLTYVLVRNVECGHFRTPQKSYSHLSFRDK
jgi:hypothetical protein